MSTRQYRSWEDRLRDRLQYRRNRDGQLVPYLLGNAALIERIVRRRKANKAAGRARSAQRRAAQ